MNKVLAIIICAFIGYTLNAQTKVLASSEELKATDYGQHKIMFLPNGNTIYVNVLRNREGIETYLYDKEFKFLTFKKVTFKNMDLHFNNVCGFFSIGNTVQLFIQNKRKIYRIGISGEDAGLIENKLLPMEAKEFLIRKNELNDSYAVANIVGLKDSLEIQAHYFNDKHELVKKFRYTKEKKGVDLSIKDICFSKHDIFISIWIRNGLPKVTYSLEVLLLKASSEEIQNILSYDYEFKYHLVKTVTQYNPISNKLIVYAVFHEFVDEKILGNSTTIYYHTKQWLVDCSTDSYRYSKFEILDTHPERKINELFKIERADKMATMDIIPNKYGGFTFINQLSKDGNSKYDIINLVSFNQGNQVAKEIFIPFVRNSSIIGSQYGLDDENSKKYLGASISPTNGFYNYDYISTNGNEYLILNDIIENEESARTGKLKIEKNNADKDAFIFDLQRDGIAPARKYLFGEPDKKQHWPANPLVSDYNEKENIYVTLQYTKAPGKYKITWLEIK